MNRAGSAWDNSAMERFLSTLRPNAQPARFTAPATKRVPKSLITSSASTTRVGGTQNDATSALLRSKPAPWQFILLPTKSAEAQVERPSRRQTMRKIKTYRHPTPKMVERAQDDLNRHSNARRFPTKTTCPDGGSLNDTIRMSLRRYCHAFRHYRENVQDTRRYQPLFAQHLSSA